MPINTTHKIQSLALLGVVSTVAFERIAATDWRFLHSKAGILICLWSVLPYVLMACATALLKTPRAQSWWFAVSAVLVMVAITAYYHTLFIHPDAQGALIFLFLPFVQSLITCGALIMIRLLAWRDR
jgi:hypothetical protein